MERSNQPGPAVGDIFDERFELLECIGSGGIGSVYRAKQLDCSRIVALKVLHKHFADDKNYVARFLREARSLSKLNHENIVVVYHIGISVSGVLYIAMELVGGKSVRQLLREKGRFTTIDALTIVRDAARALHYVHSEGIIHRDLKPDNIVLTDEPVPNTVKIIDFGLVHVDNQDEQRLTATNTLIGTAEYMSPEQCNGLEATAASDIYSLSVCLFEMLTGNKPFAADNAVGILYQHTHAPIPKLSPREVETFDACLQKIIDRGLAKEPQGRFKNMDEFAVSLDAAITRLSSGSSTARGASKSRSVLLIAGVLTAAVLLSFFLLATKMTVVSGSDDKGDDKKSKLSPLQELRVLRKRISDSNGHYEKFVNLHRAYQLISDDSGNRILRALKLGIISDYADGLYDYCFPRQSLTLFESVLKDYSLQGEPATGTPAHSFGAKDVAAANASIARIYLDWNQRQKAEQILRKTSQDFPGEDMQLLRDAIELHDHELIEIFAGRFVGRTKLLEAIAALRESGELQRFKSFLLLAEDSSRDELGAESLKIIRNTKLELESAIFDLINGDNKKAEQKLNRINTESLETIGEKRLKEVLPMVVDLQAALGQFSEAEETMEVLKPFDRPRKFVVTSKLPDNDQIVLSKLQETLNSKDRQELLDFIDARLPNVRLPALRLQLLLHRSIKSKTDYVKRYFAFLGNECIRKYPSRIPAESKLQAKLLCAESYVSMGCPELAVEIYKSIIKELAHADNTDVMAVLANHARVNFALLLIKLGKSKDAIEVSHSIPDDFNFDRFDELLDLQLRLDDKRSSSIIAKDRSIADLYNMSRICLQHNRLDLARECIKQGKSVLAKSHHPTERIREHKIKIAVAEAMILLESGEKIAAQDVLKSVLPVPNDFEKPHTGSFQELIVAQLLAGLNPREANDVY